MGFRWGTEVSHLHAAWLKEQGPQTNSSGMGAKISKTTEAKGLTTADGVTICKIFNSKTGCTFTTATLLIFVPGQVVRSNTVHQFTTPQQKTYYARRNDHPRP